MTWNSILGPISTIALFLPVILLLTFRLGAYRSFPALIIYYASVFTYNVLSEGYIKTNDEITRYWGLINNLVDAPLMMWFLTYFSPSQGFTKGMRWLIVSFVAFEVIVIALVGLTLNAMTIIMAPGLLMVLSFCLYFFIRQSRITIVHRKATGKALISAALVFAYGCYSFIYVIYYIIKTKEVDNTILIYFLVSTLSSLLICSGIVIERKRIQKLNELKITRKELSSIYKETTNTNPPYKAAMLDFDRDQWN